MVSVPVQCLYCQSTAVIKAGKQPTGTQRSQCQNDRCEPRIFTWPVLRIAAVYLRFVAKWLTWPSTGVAFAIRPACCALAPRP